MEMKKRDHGNCFWFSLEIEMTHAHKTQVLRGYTTYCDGRFGQWSVWPWKLCHYSHVYQSIKHCCLKCKALPQLDYSQYKVEFY